MLTAEAENGPLPKELLARPVAVGHAPDNFMFARCGSQTDSLLLVDVGGTRVKAALLSSGRMGEAVIEPTARTPHGVVGQLAAIHRIHGSPARWAICLPGLVRDGVWWAHQPFPVGQAPIARMLAERGLPVPFLCRDAEAALAGEADGRSIVLIQLGTGVGCGVTVNGEVLRDPRGEPVGLWMAHFPLFADGVSCARCGGRGCASAQASLRGIADQLGRELAPSELRDGACAGVRPLAEVYARALAALARLSQMAVMNFRPEHVRLAGGSAHAWSIELLPRIRQALDELPAGAVGDIEVTLSASSDLSALHGLATLAAGGKAISLRAPPANGMAAHQQANRRPRHPVNSRAKLPRSYAAL